MIKCRFLLALPLALVLAAGCSSNKSAPATVSGKVSYKGAPLTAGTMTFYPKEGGGVYTTSIKNDGTYTIADVPVGDTIITVETESANTQTQGQPGVAIGGGQKHQVVVGPKPEGWTQSAGGGGTYTKIPAKYNNKETSGQSLTVTKGKQTKDIDLPD